jgi:nitrile hydratase
MNGVFDLGGTDGLGPVVTEDNEPLFRAEWEKTAFSLFASCFRAGIFNVDMFRHGIEKMNPAEYLLSSYSKSEARSMSQGGDHEDGEQVGRDDAAVQADP